MNRLARLLGVLLLLAIGAAHATEWKMDSANSRLEFFITYEKEAAPAVFRQFDTRLTFDPRKPGDGRLNVTVTVTSADFDSADVNQAIREPEWFDFARFPKAEFHSNDIRGTGPGRYVAHGTLSLKGARKDVAVPFSWQGSDDTATMEGELTLDRSAFGIGTGEWASGDVIGLDVRIKFRVALRKAG